MTAEAFEAVNAAAQEEAEKAAAAAMAAAAAAGIGGGATRKDKDSNLKQIMQERFDLYKVPYEENELNLRRNIILGGVFFFDMLQIPPQPKRISNWIICQLETPQVMLLIRYVFST